MPSHHAAPNCNMAPGDTVDHADFGRIHVLTAPTPAPAATAWVLIVHGPRTRIAPHSNTWTFAALRDGGRVDIPFVPPGAPC